MQRSRHMRIALVLTLACLVGLAGWLALVETSACDEDRCDETARDDAPCAVCVCCPHAPRAVATSGAASPDVTGDDFQPPSPGLPSGDPPPEEILHVPRRLSSFS